MDRTSMQHLRVSRSPDSLVPGKKSQRIRLSRFDLASASVPLLLIPLQPASAG